MGEAEFGFLFLFWLFVGFPYLLHRIATAIGTPRRWRAWVPGLSFTLMTDMAGFTQAAALLMIVPGVTVFAWTFFWFHILQRIQRPMWLCAVIWIPFINALPLAYVAFTSPVERAEPVSV